MAAPPNVCLAYLCTLKKALDRFPKLLAMIEEDGRVVSGSYSSSVDDPDISNPFATSLWELNLVNVIICLTSDSLPSCLSKNGVNDETAH